MGAHWSQLFPPPPPLTEANLPSQAGKVFIVTGGYSGVGLELSRILYRAGARVYVAGRSQGPALAAIEKIKASSSSSAAPQQQQRQQQPGELFFLPLDLADLSSIRGTVEAFLKKESRLDVLWNNAGISLPPPRSATKQGLDLLVGTNCVGPFLLTQLLEPVLEATAAEAGSGAVRVVWAASQTVDLQAPKGGFEMAALEKGPMESFDDRVAMYITTKVGNWFLASEFARRRAGGGVLHVVQNPGNLRTNLLRHYVWILYIFYFLLYEPIYGAYTELYAGLSPDITMEFAGGYIVPWGGKHQSPRQDLLLALKSTEEGGTGLAQDFWDWCEKNTKEHL